MPHHSSRRPSMCAGARLLDGESPEKGEHMSDVWRWNPTTDRGTIGGMARCVLCTFPATQGHLCEAHRKAILPVGLTSEQLASRRSEGAASLVDPWGVAWPIAPSTSIGRAVDECDI